MNSLPDMFSFRRVVTTLSLCRGARSLRTTASLRVRGLVALLALALGINARAHDPGLSTATVQLRPDGCDIALVLSVKDAALLAGGSPSQQTLQALAVDLLEVTFDDQSSRPQRVRGDVDAAGNATIEFHFASAAYTHFAIQSKCLAHLPPGHRQLLSVRGAKGNVLLGKLLSAGADSAAVLCDARRTSRSTREFLWLGVWHIIGGYDHLLFLFSLLIVARNAVRTLKIITAFTIAHSLTLGLAALDLVRVPARVVEPIIAVSIIYVGVENLWRGEMPKGRALVAFAFGLIHGLGFASALREAGLDANGSGIVLPLISFNAGVELGQMLIAALVLPLMWKISTLPFANRRLIPVSSALVILAGGFGLVQRIGGA